MKVILLVFGGVVGLAALVALLAAAAFSAYMFGTVAWNAVRRPAHLSIVARIALRNLFASRLKTAVIGSIIGAGAILIVVGISFVGSVAEAMSRSIIGAAAGDVQVYAPKLPEGTGDELAIWTFDGADQELGTIPDFAKLKTVVEKVPNVKSVVPMGLSSALVTAGNTIDVALGSLRDLENKRKAGDASTQPRIEAQKAHVRHILEVLQGDQKNRVEISGLERGTSKEEVAAVNEAASPAFWASFDDDPFTKLEFMENKIAPQTADAALVLLRYIGTDLTQFQKSFDRMEIVEGTKVPDGERGFLFAKNFYEANMKLKSAKRLDDIKEAIETKHQKISDSDDLQRLVRQNTTQTREIALQMDALKAKKMVARLEKATGSKETELEKLLADFFQTTDDNFEQRYDTFYRDVAPLLELYRVRIGDKLTIKAFTKNGYVKSVTLRVYGTFQFSGLEKSALAGSLNLMDLQSFRALYGFMTPDTVAEAEAIEKQAGTRNIDRAHAEDDVFGANASPVTTSDASPAPNVRRDTKVVSRASTQSDINQGAVLNAAVFLNDPARGKKTMADIEAAAKDAGIDVRALPWQKASGMVGMLVVLFWAVFTVFGMVFAFVASIIINIALLTSTLERVREFGTLRAIGAQKPLVLSTVMVEAMVTGTVFGGIGAVLGAAIVLIVHAHGIAATQDIMYFLFSGPRFAPVLNPASLVLAVLAMVVISAFASLIPAYLAMRVTPVRAMQSDD